MPDDPDDPGQDPSPTGPAEQRALPDPAGPEGVAGAGTAAGAVDDTAPGRDVDAAHSAALDAMTELLREQARGWGRQVRVLLQLDALAERGAAAGRAQFPQLEMAGSWHVSQLTATRWQEEARRFDEALPRTLAMLETGDLLVHQASVLLHRTRHCTVGVARAVEEQVLPAGAALCPADLSRRVVRAVLRVEAELDAAATEQRTPTRRRSAGRSPAPSRTGWAWPGGADRRAAPGLAERPEHPGAAGAPG